MKWDGMGRDGMRCTQKKYDGSVRRFWFDVLYFVALYQVVAFG